MTRAPYSHVDVARAHTLTLSRAPYVLHGVKYIDPVAHTLASGRAPSCYVLYGVKYIGLVSLQPALSSGAHLDLSPAPYCYGLYVFNI